MGAGGEHDGGRCASAAELSPLAEDLGQGPCDLLYLPAPMIIL
jgi:hypothetical protein